MDPKRRQYLEAQLSAYIDGELTAAERTEVEAFLAADADARKLLAELEATAAGLRALPRAKVSPDLMEGLRSRLERRALLGDQPSKTPSASTIPFSGRWLAAAAVVVMMVTTGYVMYSFRSPEPASRNKDYALVEPAVRPGARLSEGDTRLPSAPSVQYGQEKAERAASEGRDAESKNRALNMTIEPSAALSPTAKPAKGESAVAVATKVPDGAPGRAAGETVAGTERVAAPPAQPVTVIADVGADSVADRLSKDKGDETLSKERKDETDFAARDEKSAKMPAEEKHAAIGDKVVVAAGGRTLQPSASRSMKGVPPDEQLRSPVAWETTQPAAVQPNMPTMIAKAAKGAMEAERAMRRGEAAAPSAPALGRAEPKPELAEAGRKTSTPEQAGVVPNAAVGVDTIPGSPTAAPPASETEGLALGVPLDRPESVVGGEGRREPQAQMGQMEDRREGVSLKAPRGGPKDIAARGFGGGMGGFGGYQDSLGRGRRGGAPGDEHDAARNRGVLSEYLTEGCAPGWSLLAAPLQGEPPWRPDENDLGSATLHLGAAGYLVGKPHASNLLDTAKVGDVELDDGKELGEVTTGGTFISGRSKGQPSDGQSFGRPTLSGTAGKPATQPASAPTTAPASQPANPPANPATRSK